VLELFSRVAIFGIGSSLGLQARVRRQRARRRKVKRGAGSRRPPAVAVMTSVAFSAAWSDRPCPGSQRPDRSGRAPGSPDSWRRTRRLPGCSLPSDVVPAVDRSGVSKERGGDVVAGGFRSNRCIGAHHAIAWVRKIFLCRTFVFLTGEFDSRWERHPFPNPTQPRQSENGALRISFSRSWTASSGDWIRSCTTSPKSP